MGPSVVNPICIESEKRGIGFSVLPLLNSYINTACDAVDSNNDANDGDKSSEGAQTWNAWTKVCIPFLTWFRFHQEQRQFGEQLQSLDGLTVQYAPQASFLLLRAPFLHAYSPAGSAWKSIHSSVKPRSSLQSLV